jgi:hypothetical protein
VTTSARYLKSGAACARRAPLSGLLAMIALMAWGCFNTAAPAPTKDTGLRSFLGISFGASIKDARRYYPNGINETSPLGFSSYHVTGLSSESISYPDVIYEFDSINGMQVVIARFAPASTEAVLERLRRILGEPTQHTLTPDQRMAEAVWLLPDGEEIRFDRSRHLMTVLGFNGANLRKDVQLRVENSQPVL